MTLIESPDRPSRTARILEFIRDFRAQYQVSPSVREIGRGVGISSTSVVNYHVGKLVADGQLLRAVGQGAPRNLVPAAGVGATDRNSLVSQYGEQAAPVSRPYELEKGEDDFVD